LSAEQRAVVQAALAEPRPEARDWTSLGCATLVAGLASAVLLARGGPRPPGLHTCPEGRLLTTLGRPGQAPGRAPNAVTSRSPAMTRTAPARPPRPLLLAAAFVLCIAVPAAGQEPRGELPPPVDPGRLQSLLGRVEADVMGRAKLVQVMV